MSEPPEPRKNIDSQHWKVFLEEFSIRNNNRRARFDVFRSNGRTEEEEQEAHFEEARLVESGRRRDVIVIRIGRGRADAEKIRDEITGVRGIAVQFDVDGSVAALEITDDSNSLISLRFESKVDGVS